MVQNVANIWPNDNQNYFCTFEHKYHKKCGHYLGWMQSTTLNESGWKAFLVAKCFWPHQRPSIRPRHDPVAKIDKPCEGAGIITTRNMKLLGALAMINSPMQFANVRRTASSQRLWPRLRCHGKAKHFWCPYSVLFSTFCFLPHSTYLRLPTAQHMKTKLHFSLNVW